MLRNGGLGEIDVSDGREKTSSHSVLYETLAHFHLLESERSIRDHSERMNLMRISVRQFNLHLWSTIEAGHHIELVGDASESGLDL